MKQTMSTSSTPVPSANSLCRQVGHEWDPDTISANYRRCVRSRCTAAERLVKGAWVAVHPIPRPRRAPLQTAQQGMPSLWESAPLASRLPDEEGQTASSALMRRWERQMHALVGRE